MFNIFFFFSKSSIISTLSTDHKSIVYSGSGVLIQNIVQNSGPYKDFIEITVQEGIISLGDFVFYSCEKVKTISLPPTLTSLGQSAFRDCKQLQSIIIPEGVCNIFTNTFYNCYQILTIHIPSTVTIISESLTFYHCTRLRNFTIHPSNKNFTVIDGIFLVSYDRKRIISGASIYSSITIPSSVTHIAGYAYYGHDNPRNVYMSTPCNLKSIGYAAFVYCNLLHFEIREGLEELQSNCFGSGLLQAIHLPSSLISMHTNVLSDHLSLQSVTVESGNTAFKSDGDGVIFNFQMSQIYFIPKNITSMLIPAEISSISNTLLQQLTQLSTFNVHDLNNQYSSKNNFLLDRIGKVLISAPGSMFHAIIPSSVETIGTSSFRGLLSMKTLVFETGSNIRLIDFNSFGNCRNLEYIQLPESLQSISSWAFASCNSLTNVSFPASLVSISNSAFQSCTGLLSIEFLGESATTVLYSNCFSFCSKLHSIIFRVGITSIDTYAFSDCKSLMAIILPTTLSSIGEYSFAGCSQLHTVEILSNSLNYFGQFIFFGCSVLSSIFIPRSVVTIGNYAFTNCNYLRNITFGDDSLLTTIVGVAFSGCISLETISIPKRVTSIGQGAFSGCISLKAFITDQNSDCFNSIDGLLYSDVQTTLYLFPPGLNSSIVKGNVLRIASSAFYLCTNLISLSFENGCKVQSFGPSTFYGCANLSYLTLPASITTIESYAFADCLSLIQIVVSDLSSMQNIHDNAFSGCIKLSEFIFLGSISLVSIGNSAFYGCTKLETFTPSNCLETIGSMAFSHCCSFTGSSLLSNSQIRFIGERAFEYCSLLTEIQFPTTLESIGELAFFMCSSLFNVTYCSSHPILSSTNAFQNTQVSKVLVHQDYSSTHFCGHPVWKIFTEFCIYPSDLFTFIMTKIHFDYFITIFLLSIIIS